MTSAEHKRHRRDAKTVLRDSRIDVAPLLEEMIARALAHRERTQRAQIAGFLRDLAQRGFTFTAADLRAAADAIEHAERDADGGIPLPVRRTSR